MSFPYNINIYNKVWYFNFLNYYIQILNFWRSSKGETKGNLEFDITILGEIRKRVVERTRFIMYTFFDLVYKKIKSLKSALDQHILCTYVN